MPEKRLARKHKEDSLHYGVPTEDTAPCMERYARSGAKKLFWQFSISFITTAYLTRCL